MEQVCDNLELEVPDPMVDYRTDEMLQDFAQRISGQGISFEDYLKYMGTDANTMKVQMRPNAIASIKSNLALEAIAAAESLDVSDEEIEDEIKKTAEQYNMEIDKFKELVVMDELKKSLLLRKAERLVIDSGKVGEAPKKAEDSEEKSAAKPAAKKTAAKKAEDGEEKAAAKKTTKKTEE